MKKRHKSKNGEKINRFTKRDRILKGSDYARSRHKGQTLNTLHLKIVLSANGLSQNRLGLVVSKKIGSAVKRNRVKRIIREYFRLNRHNFPLGRDVIVIAKTGADSLNYKVLKKEIDKIQDEFI